MDDGRVGAAEAQGRTETLRGVDVRLDRRLQAQLQAHVTLAVGVMPAGWGHATSSSACLRKTVLFQYGGPRLGARAGASVGSPT